MINPEDQKEGGTNHDNHDGQEQLLFQTNNKNNPKKYYAHNTWM
jgi:hypothetical protein